MQFDQLKRRQFIALVGCGCYLTVFGLYLQRQSAMRRIGFLAIGLPNDAFGENNRAAFLQGLEMRDSLSASASSL